MSIAILEIVKNWSEWVGYFICVLENDWMNEWIVTEAMLDD